MCDSTGHPGRGWKGWIEVPALIAEKGGGDWIDLSHVLNEQLPNVPFFPSPRFRRVDIEGTDNTFTSVYAQDFVLRTIADHLVARHLT